MKYKSVIYCKSFIQYIYFEVELNCHNVIWLDIQQFIFQESHLNIFIDKIQESVIKELEPEYGNYFEADEYGLPGVLKQIYARTGEGFIFIIDEWDCVFRVAMESRDVQKKYLEELKWNKSAKGAIGQIKKKEYASWIKEYTGEILLVGVSYDKKKKAHECVIEKYVKR